jgi:tetratricopeptide (TPR) repeat protein
MRGFVLAAFLAAPLLHSGPARADVTPPAHVDLSTPTQRKVSELCTRSARALMAGDAAAALGFADQALALDANDAWAHYDRAVALGNLGRVDEAVSEYRRAQARFGTSDTWGASIAIYGRAHLLVEHLRCEEAEAGYEEYADLVGKDAPKEAEMALAYASDCPLPGGARPAVSSNAAVETAGARVALAEARRREAYAKTLERWVSRVETSSAIASRPGAQARLQAVRQRVEKLAASARLEEHEAQATLAQAR